LAKLCVDALREGLRLADWATFKDIDINEAGEVREGGCLCAAVRYQSVGVARWQAACHCRFCQRLTGSVFNAEVIFLKEHVLFTGAEPKVYSYRSPDHARMIYVQFCPECGVAAGLTFERFPLVHPPRSPLARHARQASLPKSGLIKSGAAS
jgi:hypothetical protein